MELKEFGYNGHQVRTIEIDGEIWFVGKDVAVTLEYSDPSSAVSKNVDNEDKTTLLLEQAGSNYKSKTTIINESGLYCLILKSKLPSAKQFKRWVTHEVLPTLRKQSGLEGFEVFRMLDKEHQKQQMEILRNAYEEPHKANYIKANTLANKAVSSYYGFSKMIKKEDMTPEMLITREKNTRRCC
ncbi:phage repressor protein [Enterococcus faecium]|uniref:BRO-N domain-containing protein n=1 Tax=Enterococcus faecium TaxID=1352 RepID=UPI000CF098FF|nr:BRO family protein [Enterococcus faecium]PQC93526.1 phage repressor protein [Enterococcus faecium]